MSCTALRQWTDTPEAERVQPSQPADPGRAVMQAEGRQPDVDGGG